MNGWDLAEQLRQADPSFPEIRLIVVAKRKAVLDACRRLCEKSK
jgi:hypothetical protein